jgi:chorismate synthase
MGLRFLTAGESHGPALVAIIEGVPAGMGLAAGQINEQLCRRQQGYGRGGRMRIESDQVEILSGVRFGRTLGSPIALLVRNRDWENWAEIMRAEGAPPADVTEVHVPRPGHADLAGAVKYGHRDLRNVLERASARETAARVAVGAVARVLLAEFGVTLLSHVLQVGGVVAQPAGLSLEQLRERAEASDFRCADPEAEAAMKRAVDAAAAEGDTLGGVFEVVALGTPIGLGSHVHWDRRLDAKLAAAMMSIPAVKGVEIGPGFANAGARGSEVHDEILPGAEPPGWSRPTNRAGGIEGGISNGEPILVRGAMKPIPTLTQPLRSFDARTGAPAPAHAERSDVCAVPAAAVVGEAVVAWELGAALLEKVGGDSLGEMRAHFGSSRGWPEPD